MKAIFLLVRLLSYPFILIAKACKFLYWDSIVFLEERIYLSPYWEERILLVTAIVLWSLIIIGTVPVIVAAVTHIWLLTLTAFVTFIVGLFCILEAHDEAEQVENKPKEIRWGSAPFPKEEVLAMLKDQHSCGSCNWGRGINTHSCIIGEQPETCGSWREK
jgi:hypothetical protein